MVMGLLLVVGAIWLYYGCCFFPTISSFLALLFFVAVAITCAWFWGVLMKAAYKRRLRLSWASAARQRRGT
jgi:hypothetical protein